jgi:hypothetical protein
MKHKVTQKEWNDARDKFLCAFITGGQRHYGTVISSANEITSKLYEVIDQSHFVDTNEKLEDTRPFKEHPAVKVNDEFFKGAAFEVKKEIQGEWVDPTDTRPFNPKVVEIFNQYLPKEIAPLAIEAHKHYCTRDRKIIKAEFRNLDHALYHCVPRVFNGAPLGKLCFYVKGDTITATEEQLREWFPMAYQNEGGGE